MLLKVEEMKNKLLTFWNSRHLTKKKMFQIRKFCERAHNNRTFENKL